MLDEVRVNLAFAKRKGFSEKQTCFLSTENIGIKPLYDGARFDKVVVDGSAIMISLDGSRS
jgi:hypothetical protein